MPWKSRHPPDTIDICSDESEPFSDGFESEHFETDMSIPPVLNDEVLSALHDTLDTGSTSSWCFIKPQPKSIPEPPYVPAKTLDRDVQEARWRLARNLQSVHVNPLLQMPWQRTNTTTSSNMLPFVFRGDEYHSEPEELDEADPQVKRPRNSFAALRVRGMGWEQHEDLLRQRALIRWRVLIEENLLASETGRNLHQLYEDPNVSNEVELSLQDIFAGKSTATLAKRAASLMAYVAWARSAHVTSPLNVTESKIYQYLCKLRTDGARPSTAKAFLEALTFARFTIGLDGVEQVLSARVRGASVSMLLNKRPLKQALVLDTRSVALLEKTVLYSKDHPSRVAAGYFLFCIFACARFKDAMRLHEIKLDIIEGTFGFLESKTLFHKLSNSEERKTTFLPLVALAHGLALKPWGPVWLEQLLNSGWSERKFVLPALLRDNRWSNRPLTSGEASIWLRELLVAAGGGEQHFTVHGLKSTGLSWCAKFGMAVDDRRILGHHLDAKGVSALTYSRDALAGPLTQFAAIVSQIREGTFFPDESRAARAHRIIVGQNLEAGNQVSSNAVLESSSSSSSSSSLSSGTDELSDEVTEAREHDMLTKVGAQRHRSTVNERMYVHKESGLGHVLHERSFVKFKCGKRLNVSYTSAVGLERHIHMCLSRQPLSKSSDT